LRIVLIAATGARGHAALLHAGMPCERFCFGAADYDKSFVLDERHPWGSCMAGGTNKSDVDWTSSTLRHQQTFVATALQDVLVIDHLGSPGSATRRAG